MQIYSIPYSAPESRVFAQLIAMVLILACSGLPAYAQFGGTIETISGKITDAELANWKTLDTLKSLTITSGSSVTDEGLRSIGKLPGLKKLALCGNGISDAAIPVIVESFPNLEDLAISDCPVTGSTMRSLLNLNHLSKWTLSGLELTAEARSTIRELTARRLVQLWYQDNHPDISVFERVNTCFPNGTNMQYFKENGLYASITQSLSELDVEAIKLLILNSKTDNNLDLESFGIGSLSFVSNWNRALDERPDTDLVPGYEQVIRRFRLQATYKEFQDAVQKYFPSMSWESISVTFKGDPELTVYTSSGNPLLVPWHVTCGNDRWTTYSSLVSLAIMQLADTGGKHAKIFSNKRWYQRQGIYGDLMIWQHLGPQIIRRDCLKLAKAFPGFEAATVGCYVLDAEAPDLNKSNLDFSLRIKEGYGPLDFALWRVSVHNDDPLVSWDVFAKQVGEVACRAQAIPWLQEWKQKDPDHSVGTWATADELGIQLKHLSAPWKKYGLKGKPDYVINLETDGNEVALLSGSKADKRLLLTTFTHKMSRSQSTWDSTFKDRVTHSVVVRDHIPDSFKY